MPSIINKYISFKPSQKPGKDMFIIQNVVVCGVRCVILVSFMREEEDRIIWK